MSVHTLARPHVRYVYSREAIDMFPASADFLQTLDKFYIIINSNFTVCTGNVWIKKNQKLKVVLLVSSDPFSLLLAKLNCTIVCILHVLILVIMFEGDNSF